MIPTYHCAGFLGETLRSVLDQDPGPDEMQIEVVDDHSTLDDPASVVRTIGGGRVGFHRQPCNVGHVENFNTCLRRSRGQLIHLLHGDDLVRPGFYARLQAQFDRSPDIGAVFCRHVVIDAHGRETGMSPREAAQAGPLPDWLDRIASGQRLQTPSIAVRRSVYEELGGFDHRLTYCEDWEMWVRIAARYQVGFLPEPLAAYRVHNASNTSRHFRTGANVDDLLRAVEINRAHLPASRVERTSRRARLAVALAAIRRARRAYKAGDRTASRAQVRAAFRASRDPRVFAHAAGFAIIWALKYVWLRRPEATSGAPDPIGA
jgi:GT2 family glycosyltransferase